VVEAVGQEADHLGRDLPEHPHLVGGERQVDRGAPHDQVHFLEPLDGAGEVRLDAETAEAWLRAINDARLAMGTRLDIRADTDLGEELDDAAVHDPASSRVFQLSVYAYLGYLQESLLNALVEGG